MKNKKQLRRGTVRLSAVVCMALGSTAAGAAVSGEGLAYEEQKEELGLIYGEESLSIATRRAAPLRTAPTIATVINGADIRKMGARNLLDVIKTVPGFGMAIGENGPSMLDVRGIRDPNDDKILVMIDGHSLNKNLFGSSLFVFSDMLPVENIKRVEVVRGPGSALYGNGAFLATINIVTRDADDIDGVEAKIGAGSFNTGKANLVGAYSDGDKLSVTGSFDRYVTDGPRLRVESDVLRNTPYTLAPGYPNLDMRQTDAFVKVQYGDLAFRGHYNESLRNRYIGDAWALTGGGNYRVAENYWGELSYSKALQPNLTTTWKVYYDHYLQNPNYKQAPSGYLHRPDGLVISNRAQHRTWGGELQLDWDVSAVNHLVAGMSYENVNQYDVESYANYNPVTLAALPYMQRVATFNQPARRRTVALFVQDEWRVQDKVSVTTGVRADQYSDMGGTVNPRGGVVWEATDDLTAKLLYGRAFRAPTFTELYATPANGYATGNPNLKPERIRTWDASLAYRLTRAVSLEAGLFRSDITDQINRQGISPAYYRNIGNTRTQGVELALSGNQASLQWRVSYVHQDPRNVSTGDRLPYVPSQRVNSSVSYDFSPSFNVHTDLLWTGSRPRAAGETRPSLPSYAVVDLAATRRNLWPSVDLQVAIHNLLNKRYVDPDTSGSANKVPGDFPREGISLVMSVVFKF